MNLHTFPLRIAFGLSIAVCSGCSLTPITNDRTAAVIGKDLYVVRPPRMVLKKNGKFPAAEDAPPNRCQRAKITAVLNGSLGDFGLSLEQDGNTFMEVFSKDNMRTGTEVVEPDDLVFFLKTHLAPEFPFKDQTIALKTVKRSSREMICSGGFWTGMSKNEFFFALGPPREINRTVMAGFTQEQIVYRTLETKLRM